PLLRVWPRCASSATVYARRTSSVLSFGLTAVIVSRRGTSSGSTGAPPRGEKKDSRERPRRGADDGERGVETSGDGALRGPAVGAEAFEGGDAGSCDMDTSWLRGPVYAGVTSGAGRRRPRGVGTRWDQSSIRQIVVISVPGSRSRPPSPTSSMRTEAPSTSTSKLQASSSVAAAVPPVASRSSTISTRAPAGKESCGISVLALPYSRS